MSDSKLTGGLNRKTDPPYIVRIYVLGWFGIYMRDQNGKITSPPSEETRDFYFFDVDSGLGFFCRKCNELKKAGRTFKISLEYLNKTICAYMDGGIKKPGDFIRIKKIYKSPYKVPK